MRFEALNDAESLVLASGSTMVLWLGTTSLDPMFKSPWGSVPTAFGLY